VTKKSKKPKKDKTAKTAKKDVTRKKRVPKPTTPPQIPASVAVVESSASHQGRAAQVVTELGYQLHSATTLLSAKNALPFSPPDVLVVGMPDGRELFGDALRHDDRPVLVAAMPGPAVSAYERCDELGADLFTLRPHSRDGLAAILRAAVQIQLVRQRERALRGTEARLRDRLQQYGDADQTTGFQHIDFFKSFLAMEIKRARRYDYSLAACLIAIDPWAEDVPEPPPEALRQLRAQVAGAITSAMRDIDLPVDLAEDRFLAFLPYTDIDGAERVGRRIAAAVRSCEPFILGEYLYRMSVSVGIAALKPGGPVGFAKIMRDASMAVRAAQLKGGGRVVVKR
jgi:diguanylate cyclase (GGDEF)-like protein